MNYSNLDIDFTLRAEYAQFPRQFSHALMATTNKGCVPRTVQVPFAEHEGHFYICTTKELQHTRNLQETGAVSLLFADNEETSDCFQVRRRLSLFCQAVELDTDIPGHADTLLDIAENSVEGLRTCLREGAIRLFCVPPEKGIIGKGLSQQYSFLTLSATPMPSQVCDEVSVKPIDSPYLEFLSSYCR